MDGEFIETPRQSFEVVSPDVSTAKHISATPATKITPTMASLKDAKVVIEEGGCIVWGQLLDVPYKFDRLGLGYANGTQKNDQSPRSGGLMSHFISQGVNAIEDEGVLLNHIIQQYPNEVPPVSMEVWDTLGEPSGRYDFLVKYTTPQSSFIAMEDIAPTGWGDQFEDCKSFTSSITEQYQSPPSPK